MGNTTNLKLGKFCQRVSLAFVLLTAVLLGSRHAGAQAQSKRWGLPQDWSHRHVIFSRPADMATLVAIRRDPRLVHQLLVRGGLSNAGRNLAGRESSRKDDGGPDDLQSVHDLAPQGRVDWSVTLGAANSLVQRSMYPAKYSFKITDAADCSNDFVVYTTSVGGSATQATIVAYNQLYSTQGVAGGFCNHNGPAVKWAYNTGGGIRSSPTLSEDGTKVAWVSRGNGVVHVLTIGTTGANGTAVTAPAVPGTGNNAVDRRFSVNGGPTVTSSEVFVDYGDDVGYVGDDVGVLHKITGIFLGTPAEVTTGGWPIHVGAATTHLNGPVIDLQTRNIFVTDSAGNLSYVREVGSSSGACSAGAPPCLGSTVVHVSPTAAIADAPIVDSSTGRVFTESAANGVANAVVVQADTALGNVVTVAVGAQDAANPLHNGDFDNNYVNNSPASGFYYVCGKAANTNPTLYRIGFNAAGVMNAAPAAATILLARAPAQCSPATEFLNTGSTPAKEWLFIGVSTRCSATGVIPGGCVMSYNITNGMPLALTARVAERNGTSGIIIDNASQASQASSIYFTDEGTGPCGDGIATGGCAVKLTQSGLL